METIRLGNHQFIVSDTISRHTLELAHRAARSHFPVLICGPSGTGKELIARYIHLYSARAERPFVSINCAAIPENLLEAELFGFERGAFTGAISQRIGKFELASSGAILLDEISEMKLPLQAKLLRALQEGEIDRIGGKSPVCIDTRIIATSNREPLRMVEEGVFRQDLFYRLNVIRIDCPALRGRTEAVDTLVRAFVREWALRNDRQAPRIDDAVMQRLFCYDWPGNVRELRNAVERVIFHSDGGTVGLSHLDGVLESRQETGRAITLADVEREHILRVLSQNHGNRTRAAMRLGISVRTLRNKLHLYGTNEK